MRAHSTRDDISDDHSLGGILKEVLGSDEDEDDPEPL